jgi:hypothetical protein
LSWIYVAAAGLKNPACGRVRERLSEGIKDAVDIKMIAGNSLADLKQGF